MKRTTNHTAARTVLVAALVAIGMASAGCGVAGATSPDPTSPDPTGPGAGPPGAEATSTPTGRAGSGTTGGNEQGGGQQDGGSGGGGSPSPTSGGGTPEPSGGGTPEPPGGSAQLERVLLTAVALVAPTECFTEGLSTRYVDGYGAQVVDPRPHAGLVATRVEHEGLTRLRMDQADRRVNLLPGSSRAVEAVTGEWTVSVEVHMFLSGGFQLDYTRTHLAGQTGQFRETFTSPVDGTCVVELVYGLTTSPA